MWSYSVVELENILRVLAACTDSPSALPDDTFHLLAKHVPGGYLGPSGAKQRLDMSDMALRELKTKLNEKYVAFMREEVMPTSKRFGSLAPARAS
jgi:hypothetical protein